MSGRYAAIRQKLKWAAAAVLVMAMTAGNAASWASPGRESGVYVWAKTKASETDTGLPMSVPVRATPSQTQPETRPGIQSGTRPGGLNADGLSLSVSDYRLSRHDKPKESLGSLKRNGSARLTVTVTGDTFEGEMKKGDLVISRRRDGYQTDGTPSVKILSEKGAPLEFQVTFPKITYVGGDTTFHFQVRKKGSPQTPVVLAVKLDETEQASVKAEKKGRGKSGQSAQPAIRIERAGSFEPMEPGKTEIIVLRLTNTSRDTDVEGLTAVFSPNAPLYLSQDTNSHIVGRLRAGQSAEVKVTLKAGQDLPGVPQALDVELRYTYDADGQDVAGTVSQKVMVPVTESRFPGQPFIRIAHTREGSPVRPGEEFQTTVRLENISSGPVDSLVFTVDPSDQIALMDPVDTYFVGNLEPGKTAEVPVRLKASAELSAVPSQLVGVNLKFDYDSGKGTVQGNQSGKLVIPAAGGKAVSTSLTPNLIIRSYSYGGSAQAGQVFDLAMEIVNTSKNIAAENILMSLNTGEGLSINDASNTIYIPSLAPGGSVKQTVQMQALFQSKLQSPKVEISFKYEYLDNRERKQNTTGETIAIPVYQPDRLEIKPPTFPDGVREQEESPISLSYSNKGRGHLFNVEARLEGNLNALEREVTVGNLEPGKMGTIDFIVVPDKVGLFQGQVRITYEDEAMNQKEMVVPVEFTADAAPAAEEFPMPPEEKTGPVRLPQILGTAVLAAGGIAFFAVRFRRKKAGEGRGSDRELDLWESLDIPEEPDAREDSEEGRTP